MKSFCNNLCNCSTKHYSEYHEDGILIEIFKHIGTMCKFCVDIGASDGVSGSNVRYFMNKGWDGISIDRKPRDHPSKKNPRRKNYNVKRHHITAENINNIFTKYNVPCDFDLLSIDIDSNDYWIWKALDNDLFLPRVVIIEINANFPVNESKTIKYDDPARRKDRTTYYGATALAMKRLGSQKGYSLVHIVRRNAFFILDSLLHNDDKKIPLDSIYKIDPLHNPHDPKLKWVNID